MCGILGAFLLKDGRFVFLMPRYNCDLRSYIDKQMRRNKGRGPPFSKHQDVLSILFCVARGMGWLHNRDVLHRDLKAANVMVMSTFFDDLHDLWMKQSKESECIWCSVADFECSSSYLLKDGRFVFLMPRYDCDLRSYIDKQMRRNKGRGPPFSKHQDVLSILFCIARGMGWLHNRDVLHRDLKAANVMVMSTFFDDLHDLWMKQSKESECIWCSVADFECSSSTLGTGFWRAPEVLQEMQNESGQFNVNMWTKKSDFYSFAMTCFEVLTGDIPLSECSKKDWVDVIYHGKRPELPDYVDSKLQELVKKCWDKDPFERPSFDDIVDELSNLYKPSM